MRFFGIGGFLGRLEIGALGVLGLGLAEPNTASSARTGAQASKGRPCSMTGVSIGSRFLV